MTKVAIKIENITSFGGIYHIMDVFSRLGFEKLTESVLGRRGCSGKAFSHGSILGSLFFSYLCGGDCLEDINALTGQFRQRPGTLLPGADTVGRGLKELAEKNIVYKSETSDKCPAFLCFFVPVVNCFKMCIFAVASTIVAAGIVLSAAL